MVSRLGTETSPSSGDFFADHHAEERGFAGAVGADQADLLAGVQLKRGVDEYELLAVLLIDIGKRNHPTKPYHCVTLKTLPLITLMTLIHADLKNKKAGTADQRR